MLRRFLNRINLTALILGLYALPVVFLSSLASIWLREGGWKLFSLGLIFATLTTLALFFLLKQWERQFRSTTVTVPDKVEKEEPSDRERSLEEELSRAEQLHLQLQEQLNQREEALKGWEEAERSWEGKCEELLCEFANYKQKVMEELEQKRILLDEYSQTIKDQRTVIQKKQQQISEFENKVRDLSYEVKTLLQLTEVTQQPSSNPPLFIRESAHLPQVDDEEEREPTPPNQQVHSVEEARLLLRRCISSAQKITGASHFSNPLSRFRDLHIDNYTLDLRRLYDCLSSESGGSLFLYSRKEGKCLFINHQIKALLGWSPERAAQQLTDAIKEKKIEWQEKVAQLNDPGEVLTPLYVKGRTGSEVALQCLMSSIPTGLFRHHLIGVLFR